MSDAILDHGGTLVAYMGDGIMAVFGAPMTQDDHADRALEAAREMLDAAGGVQRLAARARGSATASRWASASTAGRRDVGQRRLRARRLEYTAIGDTTNTAARLEGMTKGTPYQLFVADTTAGALATPPDDLESLDELEVRGRKARA